MKINWKMVLVFVLILALIVPVYSKATETEKSILPQQTAESVIEEASEKKEVTPESLKKEENEPKKTLIEPKKLKANSLSIPANSTIADLFPDPELAESVARHLNFQTTYKNDWVVSDVVTEADLNNISSIADESTVIIKNIEGIQYLSNLKSLRIISNESLQGMSAFLKAPNGFQKLDSLSILKGGISDISPILKMNAPMLKQLNLAKNNITDLSQFASIPDALPRLQELMLDYNDISNVSPLAEFSSTELKWLHLNNNNIADLSSLKNTSMLNLVEITCENQKIYLEAKELSAKYDFTIKAEEAIGTTKSIPMSRFNPAATIDSTNSMITWAQEVVKLKPFIPLKEGGIKEGVSYGWEEVTPINDNGGQLMYSGYFYQPLEYIVAPKIISYEKQLIYDIDTPLTEEQLLQDAKVVTDKPAKITTNFKEKIPSSKNPTNYVVTIEASNIDGEDSVNVNVIFQPKPPIITADEEYTYLVGESIDANQFRLDVNANLTGVGSLVDDFDSVVDLKKVGDYVVTLSSPGNPPYSQTAIPVTVVVHVRESLELQIPSDFRMDIDTNIDSVPISNEKQTLKCYQVGEQVELKVIDRRKSKQGWTITGSMTTFTNGSGDIIQSSLKYQSNLPASSPVYLNNTNQPIEQKQATTTESGFVSTIFDLEDRLIIEIQPNDALVNDAYESKVTWTLEDAPRP
ncbi:LapB repeat-containing protein [Listeria sp. FSL L7-0091]|uniref:LapB repeat-containing protein n=1 Tax=Listeria farberi TaxID=2713500 RepID=UPI0016290656|nr:LapB repeat-containing protein [Listeria farberi]MBC2260565.1 LapB repeat-containing protein [Listeria farberi]